MTNKLRVAIATVLMIGALAGCADAGEQFGESGRSGMDMQGAALRADGILDAALGGIDPEVKWTHDTTSVGSCDVTRRRAVMTIVSADRRGAFLGIVERSWRESGYRIKAINKDVDVPAIFAQTGDGFGVSLIVGAEGQAHFEVDSPCVQESEVLESETKPNAPTYEGMEHIPRPNVRSDFWSAGAP